ncbi:MAG: hypothetical protein OXQ29_04145 [Rhodospirillaceae bacterium]|nr:hypothetical protein [Rhodospirillaceae bacterium]
MNIGEASRQMSVAVIAASSLGRVYFTRLAGNIGVIRTIYDLPSLVELWRIEKGKTHE